MAIDTIQTKTMRDALIERIYERMKENDRIFFVSADMGAPALDKLRVDFRDRFVNVGIAEQCGHLSRHEQTWRCSRNRGKST